MKHVHATLTAAALAATLVAPLGASAQTANAYEEPKVKLGKADPSIPIAGKGTVVLQVFVKADGSAQVQRVIRSTNTGDNDAAIAIAKASKYTPATRNGKPVDAFKDFTLNFADGAVTAGTGGGTGGGTADTAQMEAMLRAGNYKGARDAATSYVAAHPDSTQGYAILGASNALLNDDSAAAAAFDKAGKIPEAYVPFAAQAYIGSAAELGKEQKDADAVAAAKKAVAVSPGGASYNALGIHELAAGDAASAANDLQKASQLANADPKVSASVKATIAGNLAAAYAASDQTDKAKAAVAEATRLDPKSNAGEAVAGALAQKAQQLETDKKLPEAAAYYSTAAEFSPTNAGTLYFRAARAYLTEAKPESEKALDAAKKSLAADPNNAGGQFAMGIALAQLGKKNEAHDALEKALAEAKAANQAALVANIEDVLKQVDASGK